MSLNSSMMSLGSGASGIIAGAIVTQSGEHSPLMNFDIVGYVAIGSTLLALLVVRLLKKLSAGRLKVAVDVSKNGAMHHEPQTHEKLPQ